MRTEKSILAILGKPLFQAIISDFLEGLKLGMHESANEEVGLTAASSGGRCLIYGMSGLASTA